MEVALQANVTSFRGGMMMAAREVKAFENQVERTDGNVNRSFKNMKLAAAALATVVAVTLAAAFAGAVAAAVQFDTRLRNVQSITKQTDASLQQTGQSLLDLSKRLPQSANTLAEGLYEIASSGFAGAAGLKVLEAAATAASAGLTTTDISAKAITAVLNAYGLTAKDATDVSDVLFQTVNYGVVSFEELSGSIGNVISTAAAAKVDIGQVGSALATMTLAGISGAESVTALNRTIQSFVDPSDEMLFMVKQLGYESGTQALAVDGLRGVMEKLREATGGNITELAMLFPEIRGLKGALALMSNEGRNYAKVAAEIEDKQKRAGATAAALKEQSKAVSYQFTQVKNTVAAAATEFGMRMLPRIIDLIKEGRELGSRILPTLQDAWERMQPGIQDVADTVRNLWETLLDLGDALGPIAGGLAAMVAGGTIAAFNTLAGTLEAVSGFLAENQTLVLALATLYVARFVPALVLTATQLIATGFDKLALWLFNAVGASARLDAGLKTVGTSASTAAVGMGRLQMAMTRIGALVGALFIADAIVSIRQMDQEAKQLRETLAAPAQTTNWVSKQEQAYQTASEKMATIGQRLSRLREEHMKTLNPKEYYEETKEIGKLERQYRQAENALGDITRSSRNLERNLGAVSKQTGLTTTQVSMLADELGLNLNGAWRDTTGDRAAMVEHIKTLGEESGITKEEIAALGENGLEKLIGMAEAAKEFKGAVSEAFVKATDVVSHFSGMVDVTAQGIKDFYGMGIAQAEQFSTNIQKAFEMGYDPQLIARILEAGPAEAAPFLQELVSGHSDNLLQIVNESEQKLRDLNSTMIELARLTHRATTAETDEMARLVGVAMEVSAAKARLGAKATADAVAEELGRGKDEVALIAQMYGIALAEGINPVLAGLNRPQIVTRKYANQGNIPLAAGGIVEYYAQGGTKEKHVAQIARAGDWRVWAEPETGGEAYLPRRGSRTRAKGILDVAAGWYGFQVQDTPLGGPGDPHVRTFREGGFYTPEDVPRPPASPHGANLKEATDRALQHAYHEVVEFVKQFAAPALGGGVGYRAMMDALHTRFPGLALISGLRPGAKTATGKASYHGSGRAVDIPPLMEVFNWIAQHYGPQTRELIFSPAGNRQIWNGSPHMYSGVTRAMHWDHVHWAMRHGGVLGPGFMHAKKMDDGGVLNPGWTAVYNGLGRGEGYVGPDIEKRVAAAVASAIGGGSRGGPRELHIHTESKEPMLVAAEVDWRAGHG